MGSISTINRGFYTETLEREILEKQKLLPSVLCELVTEYLLADIRKIYQKAVESFSPVPSNDDQLFLLKIKKQWEKARDAFALEKDNPSFRYKQALGGSTDRKNVFLKMKKIQLLSTEIITNPLSKSNVVLNAFIISIPNIKYTMPVAAIFSGVNKDPPVRYFEETVQTLNEKELSLEGIENRLSASIKNIEIFAVELVNWIWIANFGNAKAFLKMGDTMISLTTPSSRERGTITAIPRACLRENDYIVLGSGAIFKGASPLQIFDAMEERRGEPPYNLINNLAYSCAEAAKSEDFYALALLRITK